MGLYYLDEILIPTVIGLLATTEFMVNLKSLSTMCIMAALAVCPAVNAADIASEIKVIESEFLTTGDGDVAMSKVAELLSRHPGNASVRMLAGRILERKGYGDLADQQFAEADRLNPDQPSAILDEFRVKLAQEGLASAQVYIRYMQKRFPEDPDVLRLAGHLELLKGNKIFAEYYYRQAVDNNPGVPGLKTALAGVLIQQGRFSEAKPLLEDDFKLKPGNPASSLAMAQMLLAQGHAAAALPYLRVCYQTPTTEGYRTICLLLVQACMAAGRYQDAMEPLCIAICMTPNRDAEGVAMLKMKMARLLSQVKAKELANTIYKITNASKSVDQKAMLLQVSADVLDRLGYHKTALPMFSAVANLKPAHKARPLVRLGDIYLGQRDFYTADQMYAAAYGDIQNYVTEGKRRRLAERAINQKRDLAWQLKDFLMGVPEPKGLSPALESKPSS